MNSPFLRPFPCHDLEKWSNGSTQFVVLDERSWNWCRLKKSVSGRWTTDEFARARSAVAQRTQGVEPGGLPLLDTSLRIAPGPHRTTFAESHAKNEGRAVVFTSARTRESVPGGAETESVPWHTRNARRACHPAA